MSIIFEKIRYKNILSTGNTFTEIDLNTAKSTLIVGENGSGKSSMIDALTFALYGKPFRKINKPQLLNTINQKDAVVEVYFKHGKDKYKIVRGIKPTIFQIFKNDTLVNQQADSRDYQQYLENNILKMNYKSFGQIVVIGKSSFVPFMQLTAQNRREIIEDILDLQIFSTMSMLLKEKVAKNKETASELKFNYELNKSKMDSASQFNESLNALKQNEKEKIVNKISELTTTLSQLDDKLSTHNFLKVDVKQFNEKKTAILDKISNVNVNVRELETMISSVETNISFYNDHQKCPTCQQSITDDFKQISLDQFDKQLHDLQHAKDKIITRLNELNSVKEKIVISEKRLTDWKRDYDVINIEKNSTIQNINSLQKELLLQEQDHSKQDAVDISGFIQTEKSIQNQIKRNISQREVLSVLGVMLKDGGLKAQIINQFIPVINKFITKYLNDMEFFVNFELDNSFNEKITSRFKEEYSYFSFSEGEKVRIDLALLLTWRAIAKSRNSVSTNLLILDEAFDGSLDVDGVDNLRKILSELTGCNIIIISHNADVKYGEFDRVVKFSKVKNFSVMERQD